MDLWLTLHPWPFERIVCGIMGGMENPAFDETQPVNNEINSTSMDETQPVSVNEPSPEASDLAQTLPVSLSSEASGLEATLPTQVAAQPPQAPPPMDDRVAKGKRPLSLRTWALMGVVALAIAALLSAVGGYGSGISLRKEAEATQKALVAQEQFQLGLQDMEAGRYDLARQRFEYVIRLDPNYPGVTEKLADVLLYLNTTATPSPVPSPTPSPTPDLRTVQELFTQAQQHLANQEWSAAIDTLLSLRKADPNYQAVWVDDMLYVAFRSRGKDKILKEGDLEGGIYDLTMAEQFGPLDADSKSLQTWARLYITGASFWELDWAQAVYYFAQVAPAMPNLRDGSGWTATERYRLALIGYGNSLADQKEWCAAAEQFQAALSLGADTRAEEALNQALQKCGGSEGESSPPSQGGGESTPTPTLPAEVQPTPTEAPPTQPPPTEAPPTTEPPPAEPSPTPGA